MGLLDALFENSSYGGQGGGLLDLLRNSQMQNNQYQPSAGFGGPSFAQQDQASPLSIGSYQMPRMGSADLYQPQQATLPPNAQPAQGGPLPNVPQMQQQQEQQLPPALGGNSVAGNFGAGLQNFVNTPGGVLGKLLGGGIGLATGQRTDPQGMQQQNLKATFEATRDVLRQSGLSERDATSKAMLAVLNPEAGKTILPEALTTKEKFQTITDAFGNQVPIFANERDQTINGKPVSEFGGGANQSMGFLAPGVKQVDSSLQGPDYLKQFSPEIQAAVKDYADGRSMPTGNPRKGFTQTVKMIAQKYGSDIGQPVDDTTFAAKRKMMTDLSSSSPNSAGGILSNGKSAFAHLAEASDRMANLGNYNGPNVPLGQAVSAVGNYVGNVVAPTPDTAAKITGVRDNLLKYGQEATKFYAGSGGGEAERMNAAKTMDPSSSSGKQQAEFLETEKSLMLDRLRAKENQVREQLGQDYLDKHRIMTPDVHDAISKIDANIARLKGETAPQSKSSKPQSVIQNGHTYNLQPDGSYK